MSGFGEYGWPEQYAEACKKQGNDLLPDVWAGQLFSVLGSSVNAAVSVSQPAKVDEHICTPLLTADSPGTEHDELESISSLL